MLPSLTVGLLTLLRLEPGLAVRYHAVT